MKRRTNARQARRLALWVNGVYLLATDTTGFGDGVLGDDGDVRVTEARTAIALDMIARSGLPCDIDEREALARVMRNERTQPPGREEG